MSSASVLAGGFSSAGIFSIVAVLVCFAKRLMTDNMGTIGPIYTRSRWLGRHPGLGIRRNQSGSRLMAGPSWPLGASYRKFCEPTDHRQRTREDGLIAAGPR